MWPIVIATVIGGVLVVVGDVIRARLATKSRVRAEKESWDYALLRASLVLRNNLESALELDRMLDALRNVSEDLKANPKRQTFEYLGEVIDRLGFADPVDTLAAARGAIPKDYWDALARVYACGGAVSRLKAFMGDWPKRSGDEAPVISLEPALYAGERVVQEHFLTMLAIRNNLCFEPLRAVLSDEQAAGMVRVMAEQGFPVKEWADGDWSATKFTSRRHEA